MRNFLIKLGVELFFGVFLTVLLFSGASCAVSVAVGEGDSGGWREKGFGGRYLNLGGVERGSRGG